MKKFNNYIMDNIEGEPALNIGIDLAKDDTDHSAAVLNLHYNGADHIIYETFDKEHVAALYAIMHIEMEKEEKLGIYLELVKVVDIIRDKCSSGNTNLWLVTCVPNYEVYIAYINDISNHDHDLVRNEHHILDEDEFILLKKWMDIRR